MIMILRVRTTVTTMTITTTITTIKITVTTGMTTWINLLKWRWQKNAHWLFIKLSTLRHIQNHTTHHCIKSHHMTSHDITSLDITCRHMSWDFTRLLGQSTVYRALCTLYRILCSIAELEGWHTLHGWIIIDYSRRWRARLGTTIHDTTHTILYNTLHWKLQYNLENKNIASRLSWSV